MNRSKKITMVSILAILVSIVSLISSSIALSSTLNHGTSSVMSPKVNSSKVLDFNVFLGDKIELNKSEGCLMNRLPSIKENAILFSLIMQKKEIALDLSFTIVNEGDVDGVLSQVNVIGLPEGFSYKLEGLHVGDTISKKSTIGVFLHLILVADNYEEVLEPISLDEIQIVFTIEN